MAGVRHAESEEEEVVGAMLWSLQEAAERQTLQIGVSACGATAVLDVLKALGVHVTPEGAELCVRTNLRRNDSPLGDYLLSRSCAGATHEQLIKGAELASGGKVTGRFFHLHPPRRVRLLAWLADWIRRGAVPVATMNMQVGVADGEEVPDAWHHQMVFGVTHGAVLMTNPLDAVKEAELHQRLCSESLLLIRRDDVLQRFSPESSLLGFLEGLSDPRWKTLDVAGQVMKMVQEEEEGHSRTSHIWIPAAYRSGVTLFTSVESESAAALREAPELSLI